MNIVVSNRAQPYRALIAGYTEAIRSSDFKANIAFLFVEFSMSPILWNYESLPKFLPVQIILVPFLIVYICMFMVLLPRYPKRGAKNFLVARGLTPKDFENVGETEDEIEPADVALCGVVGHSLVEDAEPSRWFPADDRLRYSYKLSDSVLLASVMVELALRTGRMI